MSEFTARPSDNGSRKSGKLNQAERVPQRQTICRRLRGIRSEVSDLLFDLEVAGTRSLEGFRALWIEDAIQLISDFRRDLMTAESSMCSEEPEPPYVSRKSRSEPPSASGENDLSWDEEWQSIFDARQTMNRLLESCQRALEKQPRITGNLRCIIQFHCNEIAEHVVQADRLKDDDSPLLDMRMPTFPEL